MRFKEWLEKLDEAGTDTSCIAQFARPVIPSVRRKYPEEIGGTWPGKQGKEKRIKQQPQLKESIDPSKPIWGKVGQWVMFKEGIRLVDENGDAIPDAECPNGHGLVKPMCPCHFCGWKHELSEVAKRNG